jgi:CheY-like chemotaxis protein
MTTDRVILLVEDNEDDVLLIRRAIKEAGLINPLQLVKNGEQAIDYLAGKGRFENRALYPLPSLVLLDLKLPLKSGHEVLAWIKQQSSLESMAVVVLTASEDPKDLKTSYELGASSFLVKPPAPRQLIEICGAYFFGTTRSSSAGRAVP